MEFGKFPCNLKTFTLSWTIECKKKYDNRLEI